MNIIIKINPHEDGVRCGECKGTARRGDGGCSLRSHNDAKGQMHRGPECLAAEAKVKRLVEAGEVMADWIADQYDGRPIPKKVNDWEAALAAMEEK